MSSPSNSEALERVRYLKHELNAFSQLQYKQIEVLEGLSQYMGDRDDVDLVAPFFQAHPGDDLLDNAIYKLRLQNENVRALDGLIAGLKSTVCIAAKVRI